MATAFETALTSGQTAATGYIEDALPFVGALAVAWMAPKFLKRILNRA